MEIDEQQMRMVMVFCVYTEGTNHINTVPAITLNLFFLCFLVVHTETDKNVIKCCGIITDDFKVVAGKFFFS